MEDNLTDQNLLQQQLEEKLRSTESPFTWMPDRSEFAAVDSNYILENIVKDHDSNFTVYLKYMRSTFEKGILNDPAANHLIQEWEDFFDRIEGQDTFFINNNLPLKHVLYSSKAHLMLKREDYMEVELLIEKIEKIHLKGDHIIAAINGLKANFFDKYGSQGHIKALPYAELAMRLNPDEPEWIYAVAKTLRDIRRGQKYNMEGTEYSRFRELKLFQKLTSGKAIINMRGIYFIRLGTSYHEVADYLLYEKKRNNHKCYGRCGTYRHIQDLITKGVQCFRQAVEIEPTKKTYLYVLRGFNGIRKPYSFKYKELAKTYINEMFDGRFANDDDDNKEVYYAVGKYYQHVEQNPQKCLKYIEKAAELGWLNAKKDIIYMKFNQDDMYDPHEDIVQVMDIYPDKPKKLECLCQLASYYLFIKKDLLSTVKFILEESEEDPNMASPYLRNHKSWFYNKQHFQDLLKEAMVRVSQRLVQLGPDHKGDEVMQLTDFKNKVTHIVPEMQV